MLENLYAALPSLLSISKYAQNSSKNTQENRHREASVRVPSMYRLPKLHRYMLLGGWCGYLHYSTSIKLRIAFGTDVREIVPLGNCLAGMVGVVGRAEIASLLGQTSLDSNLSHARRES